MKKILIVVVLTLSVGLLASCKSVKTNYDEAGTYDLKGKEISEDIHIQVTDVVIQNLVLNADLYIDASVGDGHVELHNVEVNGTVYVYGGGKKTIFIKNGMILKLIGYVDGRVEAVDETVIDELIVTEPGMIIENDETAVDSFPNVIVDVNNPRPTDASVMLKGRFKHVEIKPTDEAPVVLDGEFDEVKINEGSNVVIEEETYIDYGTLAVCDPNGCGETKTKVVVKKTAKIQKLEKNHEADIEDEGEIEEVEYGEDYQVNAPMVMGNPSIQVAPTGDYILDFEVNIEGTLYVMVQPYFDSTNVMLTADDVINNRPFKFEDNAPEGNEGDLNYVVSFKTVQMVFPTLKDQVTGYMGDYFGERPDEEMVGEIQFDSVVWYVFQDKEGNVSEVGKIIFNPSGQNN